MSDKQKRAEEPLERIGIRALKLAHDYGHEYATLEHLLASILMEDEIGRMFDGLQIDTAGMKQRLEDFFKAGIIPLALAMGEAPKTTVLVEKLVFRAAATGKLSSKGRGDGVDLLLAMLKEQPDENMALILLRRSGITDTAIKQFVTSLKHAASPTKTATESAPIPSGDIKDRGSAEAYLGQYAANLNKKAAEAKSDPLIGRSTEVAEAIQIFTREKKNNPLLVGDPGVGKTAIVEGMAHLIINKQVPSVMEGTVIYSLDIGALLAG
ncbi:MAG: ATP-dependent Clp protease ATP-binding subunit ClpA, partial [Stutzerimonas stutzeri]